MSSPIASACVSDDGAACAAVTVRGEVAWLAPDLMPRWEKRLPHPARAAALDAFGQHLAVADDQGGVHLFDRQGNTIGEGEVPVSLHHLAFAPALSLLVGAADYGLIAGLDLTGKLQWRAGVVSHIGGVCVVGDTSETLLACFSDGVQRYAADGQPRGRLAAPPPCRLVSVGFDGRLLLTCGMDGKLLLTDGGGTVLGTHLLDRPPVALALGGLGRDAWAATASGIVVRLALDFAAPAG